MRTHSPDEQRRTEQARTGWTDRETRALVDLYGAMLALQTAGSLGRGKRQTSKAVMVRTFIALNAPGRSKGSVEAKLMNLSAVRVSLGLDIVQGFKPLANMSTSCRQIASDVWGAQ